MQLTQLKTNFSARECELLIKILNVKNSDKLTATCIAKQLNISLSNPYLYALSKYLIANDIIKVKSFFGANKLLEINHNKLLDLIDSQQLVNMYYEFFYKYHIIQW